MECYIYKITYVPMNKHYVGQTQQFKHKNGTPYKYGLTGRWCDHVSSSRRSDTPLHKAIREYGSDQFKIELLETTTETLADEREAHWITELKSTIPDGYNVMRHSRCKHRKATTLVDAYLDTAESVELKIIKKDGIPKLVYVYITTSVEKRRLTFGQAKSASFEDALREANEIVEIFRSKGVRVIEEELPFKDEVLQKIRVVPFNKTMVAVYLKPTSGVQKRVCFGGKTISFDQALENARDFVSRLKCNVLEDNLLKSRQQVATSSVEANTEEE